MPCSESSRADDRVLGEHLVDPEVLADVAQEVDGRHRRGPVQVVDHDRGVVALEGQERLDLRPDAAPPRRRPSPWSLSVRSDGRPRVADQPGRRRRPARAAGGRRAAAGAAVSSWTRWPWCRLGAVGSKPHVEGDRARRRGPRAGRRGRCSAAIRPRHCRSSRSRRRVRWVVTRRQRCRISRVRAATRHRRAVRRHGRLAGEPEPPRARRAVAGDAHPRPGAAPRAGAGRPAGRAP